MWVPEGPFDANGTTRVRKKKVGELLEQKKRSPEKEQLMLRDFLERANKSFVRKERNEPIREKV